MFSGCLAIIEPLYTNEKYLNMAYITIGRVMISRGYLLKIENIVYVIINKVTDNVIKELVNSGL